MNFQTMNKQRKFVLIAAAIGFISMFLPWVSISLLGFTTSVNGMHGIGILVFLCFIACGVVALMGDQTKNLDKTFWMVVLLAGGLAAVIMVINFLRMLDNLSFTGYGFYIGLIASLAIVYSAYMFRSPTDNLKDGFDTLKKDIDEKMKNSTTNSTNNPV